MQGKIIRGIAGFYYVFTRDGQEIECKAKGIFRNQKIKPLVGDEVEVEILDVEKKVGQIISISDRRSELIRPAVANIDQVLVIFAVAEPAINYNLLDRFLIMMEKQKIETIICFNKVDKAKQIDQQEILDYFKNTGYRIIFSNAITGEGVTEIRQLLKGKSTALAGPSGVGKSSLTNQIQQEVTMQTGQISEKIKRGKHTTRHTEFIFMGDHTFLLDTPGFSSLYLQDIEAEELKNYYPEFQTFLGECRFLGCNHINEPDCAVKNAVACKTISDLRYQNYKLIYEELKSKKKY